MRMRFCLLLGLMLGWAPSLPADILYSVVNLGTLGGTHQWLCNQQRRRGDGYFPKRYLLTLLMPSSTAMDR